MDRLSYEAKRAMEAGMSYGKWKALHPVSDYQEETPEEGHKQGKLRASGLSVCPQCGKQFLPHCGGQRYCELYCQREAGRIRAREKYWKDKEGVHGDL